VHFAKVSEITDKKVMHRLMHRFLALMHRNEKVMHRLMHSQICMTNDGVVLFKINKIALKAKKMPENDIFLFFISLLNVKFFIFLKK